MRFIVLFCVFCLQFSFSQESRIMINDKLKGKELAKKNKQILDSLILKYDSIANNSSVKEVFDLEMANKNLGSYFFKINSKYAYGNNIDLQRILVEFGYDFLHVTIDEKIKNNFYYIFYKGNLQEQKEKTVFEKKLLAKLNLEKVVKLEYYKTYTVSIINSLLIKSFENEYKNVFDKAENRLQFSGKINQFINALNGFFPQKITLIENSDDVNLYDITIDVSSLEACLEELKFMGFIIEEKNEMLHHTYFKMKK